MESEIERKRARDRKAQQAMRDRTKWTVQSLSYEVSVLNQTLEEKRQCINQLSDLLRFKDTEIEQLRAELAALRLRFMCEDDGNSSTTPLQSARRLLSVSVEPIPLWKRLPLNVAPTCLSDSILQRFLEDHHAHPEKRDDVIFQTDSPNLASLIGRQQIVDTSTSDIVLGIVKSYSEIETLPKQVAVHFSMSRLLKWQLNRDEASFNNLPVAMRPIPEQLHVPHPSWVDRIQWPRVRKYLIEHPAISFHDFAAAYSSSFSIRWDYNPSFTLVELSPEVCIINPVFEQHISKIENWLVGDKFRDRFPEIAALVDDLIAENQ